MAQRPDPTPESRAAGPLFTPVPARHGMVPGSRPIEKARDPRGALLRLTLYLRPFAWQVALALVMIVIGALLDLLGPYLVGVAIDRFISRGDLVGLGRIALLMLASFVASWGLHFGQTYAMVSVSKRALRAMRRDLFEHLQRMSLGFFDSRPQGELMSRLTNDIDAIRPGALAERGGPGGEPPAGVGHHGGHAGAQRVARAGGHRRDAPHALAHGAHRPGHAARLPPGAGEPGEDERHHGREHQRGARGAGLQPPGAGHRRLSARQPGGARREHPRPVAGDDPAAGADGHGQRGYRHRRRPGRLARAARDGECGHRGHLHHLLPALLPALDEPGRPVQLYPVRAGGRRAGVQHPRRVARAQRCAGCHRVGAHPGRGAVRARGFPLCARRPGVARRQPAGPSGADDRPRGADRRGQDDDRQPAHAASTT